MPRDLEGETETLTPADPSEPRRPAAEDDARPAMVVAEAPAARYRVDGLISRGGMGEVFSAHDEQLGRSVAVKRLRAKQLKPEATARFLREARIQGRLEHPAVVPVYAVAHEGEPFFVMRQLAGTTLSEMIAADRAAPQRATRQRMLRAFTEVCLAVEFAHTRGVVHRDLKPSNIMLGEFGEVYVLDWGIARVVHDAGGDFADVDTVEGAGTTIGTPGYMAPEQVRGEADLDGRVDVYALGCVLFELLAGQPLHPRGAHGLASALIGVDARPSAHAPEREVPPELDAVCVAATALDRGARTATARELGDAVQRYLDGDRDLSLRRELAGREVTRAREGLAPGASADERSAAIRAAARALALDPHAREPAELLGRLMLEPPAETPREVERELEVLEHDAMRLQARLGSWALASYLTFFPILYWAGLREPSYHLLGLLGVAVAVASVRLLARSPTPPMLVLAVAGNALLIAFFSRFLSPFLVAPSLGAVTAMWFAIHPRGGRTWALWLAIVAGVLGPWALELAGVLSPTTSIDGNRLVLETHAAEHMDPRLTLGAMALYTVALIATTIAIARSQATSRHAAQRALQSYVWQLRQLLPSGTER